MNKILVFLLTIGCYSQLLAQQPISEEKLTELWVNWQDETLDDTTRFDSFMEFIWEGYLFTQPDSAYYFAQILEEKAREKNLTHEILAGLRIQAISSSFIGMEEESGKICAEALSIAEENKDKGEVSSVCSNCGLISLSFGKFDAALTYMNRSLEIAVELKDTIGIATEYLNIGNIYQRTSRYLEAEEIYRKTLMLVNEDVDLEIYSKALQNQANTKNTLGKRKEALELIEKARKAKEKLGDPMEIASTEMAIGSMHAEYGDVDKAIEIYLEVAESEVLRNYPDKEPLISLYGNLSSAYMELGEVEIAIAYTDSAITLSEEAENWRMLGLAKNGKADFLMSLEKYAEALSLYKHAEELYGMMGDPAGVATAKTGIAKIKLKEENYVEASEYALEAKNMAEEIDAIYELMRASEILYLSYKQLGRSKEALEAFELHNDLVDSLNNMENTKELFRMEYQYTYEKKTLEDSIRNEEEKKIKDLEIAKKESQLQAKKKEEYMLYGGLGLVILFLIFVTNRFMVANKQKKIITEQRNEVEEQKTIAEQQKEEAEMQRELVEEKNKEITDSITYANRIQSAILPPQKLVKEYLQQSFILYLPKDIVAGDFYWMEHVGDKVLFAACDCTGHGVPGAMVSVVCNNALNRSVREFKLTEPGEILNRSREIVVEEFSKSDEEVKDGMDISICTLDLNSKELQWSGANNPLWIVRRKDADFEVIELKPNKQPIGQFIDPKPFETHTVELQEGDTLYLFSDGYQDQFGGEKGKKFKPGNLKKLLTSIQEESMDKQREILFDTFNTWKGEIEQIDDVCVIGVRI